jgi:hypothetical protein
MGKKIIPDEFAGKLFPGWFRSEAGNNDFFSGTTAASKSDKKQEHEAVPGCMNGIFELYLVQHDSSLYLRMVLFR